MSSESSLALTFGVLLFAMGFTWMFYGIICVQFTAYFQTYAKRDMWWLRALTTSIWICNTVHIALVMHAVYFYLITATVDPDLLSLAIWSLSGSHLVAVLIFGQVYSFYAWRILMLGRKYIPCLIVAILTLANMVLMTAFFFNGILGGKKDFHEMKTVSSSSMKCLLAAGGLTATVEVLVGTFMCRILARGRTGHRGTDSTINALMAYTIKSGLVAFIVFLAAFTTRFIWPDTFLSLFFALIVPPLRTNAFLGSLNSRETFKSVAQDAGGNGTISLRLSEFAVAMPQSLNETGSEIVMHSYTKSNC